MIGRFWFHNTILDHKTSSSKLLTRLIRNLQASRSFSENIINYACTIKSCLHVLPWLSYQALAMILPWSWSWQAFHISWVAMVLTRVPWLTMIYQNFLTIIAGAPWLATKSSASKVILWFCYYTHISNNLLNVQLKITTAD